MILIASPGRTRWYVLFGTLCSASVHCHTKPHQECPSRGQAASLLAVLLQLCLMLKVQDRMAIKPSPSGLQEDEEDGDEFEEEEQYTTKYLVQPVEEDEQEEVDYEPGEDEEVEDEEIEDDAEDDNDATAGELKRKRNDEVEEDEGDEDEEEEEDGDDEGDGN